MHILTITSIKKVMATIGIDETRTHISNIAATPFTVTIPIAKSMHPLY